MLKCYIYIYIIGCEAHTIWDPKSSPQFPTKWRPSATILKVNSTMKKMLKASTAVSNISLWKYAVGWCQTLVFFERSPCRSFMVIQHRDMEHHGTSWNMAIFHNFKRSICFHANGPCSSMFHSYLKLLEGIEKRMRDNKCEWLSKRNSTIFWRLTHVYSAQVATNDVWSNL